LVSTLAGSIHHETNGDGSGYSVIGGGRNHRSPSYGRLATDENEPGARAGSGTDRRTPRERDGCAEHRGLSRGEDRSDDGSGESTTGGERDRPRERQRKHPPPAAPFRFLCPPSGYVCPLTLRPMEDPVVDPCGHTFERRALLGFWLASSNRDRGSGGGVGRATATTVCCPISRKPMMLLPLPPVVVESPTTTTGPENGGNGGGGASGHDDDDVNNHNDSSRYDRILRRNRGLQQRIQEWKLKHPMYQGAEAGYTERQRTEMLWHGVPDRLGCQHGDAEDGESNDEIDQRRLSRFDRMLLPQERLVLTMLEEKRDKRRREAKSKFSCRLVALIAATVLVWIAGYTAVRFQWNADARLL